MNIRIFAVALLLGLSFFAVFGPYVPVGSMGHDMHCPYAPGGTALCGLATAHLEHWLAAFAATLVEMLALGFLTLLTFRRFGLQNLPERRHERYRRRGEPERPTLFQELFSQGILNRKESCGFVV